MKKLSRTITGALLLALSSTFLSTQSLGKVLEGDYSSLRADGRSVASFDPPDLSVLSALNDPIDGKALYELGLGVGGAMDTHYPGSSQSHLTVLPFPYAVYRGTIIRSDRGGTRAKLLEGANFDFSLSGTGAFPVKSDDDEARRGMSDLGWMGQIGPKLRVELWRSANGTSLRAGVSGRFAMSVEDVGRLQERGFVFEPEIVFQRPNTFVDRLDVFSTVSASFATDHYMDYLYGISQANSTANRAVYQATGGYLESSLEAGFSYRTLNNRHKIVVSVDAGTLQGATNVNSPLVRTQLDLTAGVAWVFTLYESEEKAVASD